MKFPKEVKVIEGDDINGSKFLMLDQDDATDGQKVAIYTLKEIKTLRISKSLE